jgi:putative PIN family toxin of toxin-antitoxin system
VLDTNVLLISIPSKSKYRPIFDCLQQGKFELFLTNEILNEYTEIIGEKTNQKIAVNVSELLLTLPNVHKIDPSYNWNLIFKDPDDNKFVDCAIFISADYIVTNDKHFNVLKDVEFPQVKTISSDDFLKKIKRI